MSGWQPIIDGEAVPTAVFDVIAKYWDAGLDRFLMRRFANCIQHDGRIFWPNPFGQTVERIELITVGYRPTHWMHLPEPPVPA